MNAKTKVSRKHAPQYQSFWPKNYNPRLEANGGVLPPPEITIAVYDHVWCYELGSHNISTGFRDNVPASEVCWFIQTHAADPVTVIAKS